MHSPLVYNGNSDYFSYDFSKTSDISSRRTGLTAFITRNGDTIQTAEMMFLDAQLQGPSSDIITNHSCLTLSLASLCYTQMSLFSDSAGLFLCSYELCMFARSIFCWAFMRPICMRHMQEYKEIWSSLAKLFHRGTKNYYCTS